MLLGLQAAPPVKEVPSDLPPVKPSLRHLDSVDSGAVTAPEVYSPTAHTSSPLSPYKQASAETAVKQEVKAEDAGAKMGTTASNTSSAAPAAKSFNWASIKVWLPSIAFGGFCEAASARVLAKTLDLHAMQHTIKSTSLHHWTWVYSLCSAHKLSLAVQRMD